jgi:homoserine dehydrogenase
MQKIALIGFGNVGQGLAEILHSKKADLKRRQGYTYQLVAVCDAKLGAVHDPEGLDLARLLKTLRATGSLEAYRGSRVVKGWDALRTIRAAGADVVVELAWTDLTTGQPAIRHCETALKLGKHVVTSNKGPAALAQPRLARLAARHGVQFRIEGTVMSGTPVLSLALENLAGNNFLAIQGILNGTTNYILSEMETGADYAAALAKAQAFGYAEADPTGDVEGHDAAGKVTILANLLMGGALVPADVKRRGITGISAADVAKARAEGKRWKLIGSVRRLASGGLEARVEPLALPLADPLAGVMGPTNAISFETDLLGKVTMVGPGAGRVQTGFAILSDLLAIERSRS